MEQMVTHVGKKTAAEWFPLIEAFRQGVQEEHP
jgi:hypothetical protein